MATLEKFIAMPVSQAKTQLEEMGFKVQVEEFSKPKTSQGEMLVVKCTKENNNVLLWVADFKTDIKGG